MLVRALLFMDKVCVHAENSLCVFMKTHTLTFKCLFFKTIEVIVFII